VPNDPKAAERATAALAATTDEQLITCVRAGLAEVVAAQRVWRADPSYPSKTHPMRPLFDGINKAIIEAGNALQALPDDATPRAAVDCLQAGARRVPPGPARERPAR
jgi:hypothetical protein